MIGSVFWDSPSTFIFSISLADLKKKTTEENKTNTDGGKTIKIK